MVDVLVVSYTTYLDIYPVPESVVGGVEPISQSPWNDTNPVTVWFVNSVHVIAFNEDNVTSWNNVWQYGSV